MQSPKYCTIELYCMVGEWSAIIGPLVSYVLKPEVYKIIWIIKATSQPSCLPLLVETLLQLGPEKRHGYTRELTRLAVSGLSMVEYKFCIQAALS
jgi:hypothetical protein